MQVPQASQIHYAKLFEGLKKQCKEPVKQAEPMTHDTLRLMFDAVNFADELEAVAWVVTLVGFTLVLRVSNLGPVSRTKFNPHMHFMRQDLLYKENIKHTTQKSRNALSFNSGTG